MEPSAFSPPPPSPAPSTAPAAPPRNWWQRNWKWFVPTGCLTLLALFLVFIAGIMLIVFSAMKSSDAYKIALARAKADPRVEEAIGTPIKAGLFVSGSTKVTGESGRAVSPSPFMDRRVRRRFTPSPPRRKGNGNTRNWSLKSRTRARKSIWAERPTRNNSGGPASVIFFS